MELSSAAVVKQLVLPSILGFNLVLAVLEQCPLLNFKAIFIPDTDIDGIFGSVAGKSFMCKTPMASKYSSRTAEPSSSTQGTQVTSPVDHWTSNIASLPRPECDKTRDICHSEGFWLKPGN